MSQPYTPLWNSVGAWTATAVSRILAGYAVLQGLEIMLFSEKRWSGPAFKTAMQLWGAPDSWGLWLCIAGGVALFGSATRRMVLTSVGHLLSSIWSLFFAVTLIITALRNPGAAVTGVFVYGAMAVVFMVIAVSARQLERE